MSFLEQLGQLIKAVLIQYSSNFFAESVSIILLSIIFVVLLLIRSEVCNYFNTKNSLDKTNILFNLLAEISIPLLCFISLKYLSTHFQNAKLGFLIFNSFIYIYFGLILIKYSKYIPTITENKLWIYALNALIIIASVSHLLINLSVNFHHTQMLLNPFVFLLENSAKYLFFIIFFRSLNYIYYQNKHRFGFTGIIISGLYPILYYLYMALFISILWLIVIIKLNFSYFIGILSILVVITLFMVARAYIFPLFKLRKMDGEVRIGPYNDLYQSLQTLAILGIGWALYNIGLKHFKFENLVSILENKHFIVTDLVKISYFSLISDAFLFLVLFTLLVLLKNLLSIYERNKSLSSLKTS